MFNKSEIDIWIIVMEKNDYHFIDECSNFNSDTNIMKFRKFNDMECSIYFNYKTGDVKYTTMNKEEEDRLKESFKIIKRENLINNLINN